MQLGLSDMRGATGNVRAVKYYIVFITELDCTRNRLAFKIYILLSLTILKLILGQSLPNMYFNDRLKEFLLVVVVIKKKKVEQELITVTI